MARRNAARRARNSKRSALVTAAIQMACNAGSGLQLFVGASVEECEHDYAKSLGAEAARLRSGLLGYGLNMAAFRHEPPVVQDYVRNYILLA